MSSTGAGYDYSAGVFSPDGRIFQIEYAAKAVENSGTAIGLKCRDGIVLAVEKVCFHRRWIMTFALYRLVDFLFHFLLTNPHLDPPHQTCTAASLKNACGGFQSPHLWS